MGETSNKPRDYLEIWTAALSHLEGWTQQKVEEWARTWKTDMEREGSLFYHEDPFWYIAPLLTPKSLQRAGRPRELSKLWERIARLLRKNNAMWWNDNFDWSEMKARLDDLISDFSQTRDEGTRPSSSLSKFSPRDLKRDLPDLSPPKLTERYVVRTWRNHRSKLLTELPGRATRPGRVTTDVVEAIAQILAAAKNPYPFDELHAKVSQQVLKRPSVNDARFALKFLRDAGLVERRGEGFVTLSEDLVAASRRVLRKLSRG